MLAVLSFLKKASRIKKEKKRIKWTCRKCGFSHTGEYPAPRCPKCNTIGEEAFEGV